jgi:hypothetical protein
VLFPRWIQTKHKPVSNLFGGLSQAEGPTRINAFVKAMGDLCRRSTRNARSRKSQTVGLFDALAPAQHGGAQATGMTSQAEVCQGVRGRPQMTNDDHRPPLIRPVQSPEDGRDLEGGGRVGLYAGFCVRRSRDRRWRPSISACSCRQALAAYPQARASSPQSPAPATASRRRPCLALLRVGFTEPPRSPGVLVSSYLTVSPLPAHRCRRSVLCGTFPRVTPGCR